VCANYFFETMGVLGLAIITGGDIGCEFEGTHPNSQMLTFPAVVYLLIASYFMGTWAKGKYRRYKKEFDPKVFPGKRWIVYPPFL